MKKTSLKDKSIISILFMLVGICVMILGSITVERWNVLGGVVIIVIGMIVAMLAFALLIFPVYWYHGKDLDKNVLPGTMGECEFRTWFIVGSKQCKVCRYHMGSSWIGKSVACKLFENKMSFKNEIHKNNKV